MSELNEIFDTSKTFGDLGLRDSVLRGVEAAGFKHPTHIQCQLVPAVLSGKDVIGQAKTGTGKTAAFGLPMLNNADPNVTMQALVLTPTRELAAQVAGEIEEIGRFTPIRTSCIIGGESMREQSRSLAKGGHIIVGTPGRVMDMQGRGQLNFDSVRFVILDEVDRMLDIGFREDIRKILKMVRHEHQTVFVSATVSEEIERLARTYMKPDALKIVTTSGSLTVSLVDQKYLSVEPWDKRDLLLHLLKYEKPDLTVVFCRTKATVHKIAKFVRGQGINCKEIHGDLTQQKRNAVMSSMRKGQIDVLVASDLAARGLDIEDISHVINYDLPEDPEVYIHRIGRTARAGRKGVAWSFVTPDQGQLLTEIEKISGALIEHQQFSDFKPGPVPEDIRAERKPWSRPDPAKSLANRAQPHTGVQELSEEDRQLLFPNGVVPSGPPKRNLGSRFRTKRR
jgi:ATP-dependent RNA helicase DeaD